MRSEKQKLANYTELVHAGEGVTIEKGVISASGEGSGSGGGVLVVTATYNENVGTLDKTWNEIKDALINGILPVVFWVDELSPGYGVGYITLIQFNNITGKYVVSVNNGGNSETFLSENPDGTPTFED